jgi:hypothetical protein
MSRAMRINKLRRMMLELEELISWSSLQAEHGGCIETQILQEYQIARIHVRRVLSHETEYSSCVK